MSDNSRWSTTVVKERCLTLAVSLASIILTMTLKRTESYWMFMRVDASGRVIAGSVPELALGRTAIMVHSQTRQFRTGHVSLPRT